MRRETLVERGDAVRTEIDPAFPVEETVGHADADAVLELLDLDLVGVDLCPQGRLDRLLLLQHGVVRRLHDAAAKERGGSEQPHR